MSGFDILSTVTAAQQFAEVVFRTITLVKSVIDQIQDAPDQIRRQIGRLESLTCLANQIQNTETLRTEDINKILTRCESHTQSLKDLLQKISFESHDPIREKTWRAIFSLKEETNILKLFDMLDQEYNSLNTHINLRILAVTQNVQAGYDSIDTKIDAIVQAADSSPDSLKCLRALFITDPAMDRAKLITSKGELVPGTCDWITQRKEFTEWRTSDGGLLWISGGPGLGKTMLSIYLTEYLSSCFRSHDDEQSHYSTYFFCDAKDSTRNNAIALLRGLLFQLLQRKKEFIQQILPTYQIQKHQLFDKTSFEALWKYFLDMVNNLGNSQVTCILDGLDECEPTSLELLLTKLNNITTTSPRLKIIVLSREYPQCLGYWLHNFLRIRLDPDAKTEVSDGLDLYISTRVAELSKRKQYPPNLENDVKKILRDKSTGTYLWVSFVVKDLQEIGRSEVKRSLEQFPRGLDALYERILNQIKPAHQGLTFNILRWCTFAVRPLKLDELVAALNIQPTGSLDEATVLREKLAACGHIVNITDDDTVTLVHQSAYDFLTAPFSDSESIPWFSLCRVEAEHSKMASACIGYFQDAYLNNKDVKYVYLREKMPFFNYAGRQWVDHFNRSGQQGVKVLDEYPTFFSNKSGVWNAWIRMGYYGGYRYSSGLGHIATELGLTALMQRIVKEQGTWLYLKDTFAKSNLLLHLAVRKGHLPIVEMLINNKMNIDAKDGEGDTPLHQAAKGGQLPIFEVLLKNKARINVKNHKGQTPLHLAAQKGHLPIAEMLVKNNADIHGTDRCGETPLYEAADNGHLPIVEMLIENGAGPDSMWEKRPVCVAARRGHFEIVEYLLKCGASANSADPRSSPLVEAIYFGNPELVKLLLERGADVRMRNGDELSPVGKKLWDWPTTLTAFLEVWAQWFCTEPSQFRDMIDFGKTTALHLACKAEDLPAMYLLLDPMWSLDLNWRDENGNTPLHLAVEKDTVDLVEVLLTQSSVEPQPVNKWGLNPCRMALLHNQTAMVRHLMKECNISLPESDENCRWSAIHLVNLWAGRSTNNQINEILQFLIEELGVDPQFRTPGAKSLDVEWHRHHYLGRNPSVMESIKQPDFCYETPLSLAIRLGCPSAVKYFLDRCNVDPNAPCRGCDGASPLHVAAQSLHHDIVKLLISKKAKANCLDNYRRTPLHLLTSRISSLPDDLSWKIDGENNIIKTLLRAGAQTSTADVNGRTPRDFIASGRKFKSTRELLGRERIFDKPFQIIDKYF